MDEGVVDLCLVCLVCLSIFVDFFNQFRVFFYLSFYSQDSGVNCILSFNKGFGDGIYFILVIGEGGGDLGCVIFWMFFQEFSEQVERGLGEVFVLIGVCWAIFRHS